MSHTDAVVEFLHHVPLFHHLKDKHLKQIARRFIERNYSPGDIIIEQGKLGVGLFIIVGGEVEVIRERPDGTKSKLNTLTDTDFFGELSLLEDAPHVASVISTSSTQCLALTKLDFLDELEEEPEMAVDMLRAMAHRLRKMAESMQFRV